MSFRERRTLKFVNVVKDASVTSLYNAAVMNQPISFNDDNGECAGIMCTARGSHPSCIKTNGITSPFSNPPVVAMLGYEVDAAPGGCCTANSCVYAYFDTETISAPNGGTFEFQYGAFTGGDWYEVAAVLYSSPGDVVEDVKIFRGHELLCAADKFVIQSGGDYFLRFFAGSYDETGGTKLGATLRIDSFGFLLE